MGMLGEEPIKSPSENDSSGKWNLLKLIQEHYGNTTNIKSEAQIKRESHLLPGIKFNRWFCMPAAIIVQFCVGSVYAWSVFNKPIDELIYNDVKTPKAPITFTIAIGLLGFSAAVMGPWLERRGPKLACLLGTSLFFIGNLLTALALHLKFMWLVFVGYGVIGGFGIGLCYISPVSVLQKWFPDHRGLASGVAVCGFGAGSIAMAKIQVLCISAYGLPLTFVVLGCIYFVVMVIAACVLRTPPPDFKIEVKTSIDTESQIEKDVNQDSKPKSSDITLMDAITSKDFRLMYIMFLANIIFGLVLLSRLSDMVSDIFEKNKDEAATVVSINGGFNLAGRLIFSIASDYVGRKNCYFTILTIQLIVLCAFSTITTTKTYWAFLFTMWSLTTCYGAGFSCIPAFLSDKFGPKNIGACHGVILTAWSIAGVAGGLIFTVVFNHVTSLDGNIKSDPFAYNVNAWWLLGVVAIGWIAMIFVKPTYKDQQFIIRVRALMFCKMSDSKMYNVS